MMPPCVICRRDVCEQPDQCRRDLLALIDRTSSQPRTDPNRTIRNGTTP